MDRPTLRQLEAFEAVARLGGFRAAARELGVSQVAISDHIRQLEGKLGALLFDRARGSKTQLSEIGVGALARARLVLVDCDALVAAVRMAARPIGEELAPPSSAAVAVPRPAKTPVPRRTKESVAPAPAARTRGGPPPLPVPAAQSRDEAPIAPQPEAVPAARHVFRPLSARAPSVPVASAAAPSTSPITIGTHPSIFARFQDQLAAFEDAFPERQLSLDFGCFVADRVALAFSEGRVDLAYFYALGETRAVPSDYLWSERWSLYVGSRHRLAQRDLVRREDLAREPLMSFAAGNRLRPLVDACLADAGLDALPMALETDDFTLLTELTQDGAGILPLFGEIAAQIGAAPGIKRLAYADPIPAVEVRRALHPRIEDDAMVQALVGTLA